MKRTLVHTVTQICRLPHQVAFPTPRALEPCPVSSALSGQMREESMMIYRPGLNMVDVTSGDTVHWTGLVTR